MDENDKSVNASSIGGGGWYVLQNVGDTELAKDFLKETFATNVDLMNQLATDITLVSTMNAAADAENYKTGSEFFGDQENFHADFAKWTAEVLSKLQHEYLCNRRLNDRSITGYYKWSRYG